MTPFARCPCEVPCFYHDIPIYDPVHIPLRTRTNRNCQWCAIWHRYLPGFENDPIFEEIKYSFTRVHRYFTRQTSDDEFAIAQNICRISDILWHLHKLNRWRPGLAPLSQRLNDMAKQIFPYQWRALNSSKPHGLLHYS